MKNITKDWMNHRWVLFFHILTIFLREIIFHFIACRACWRRKNLGQAFFAEKVLCWIAQCDIGNTTNVNRNCAKLNGNATLEIHRSHFGGNILGKFKLAQLWWKLPQYLSPATFENWAISWKWKFVSGLGQNWTISLHTHKMFTRSHWHWRKFSNIYNENGNWSHGEARIGIPASISLHKPFWIIIVSCVLWFSNWKEFQQKKMEKCYLRPLFIL